MVEVTHSALPNGGITKLPEELHEAICSHCPTPDLYCLCLTNKNISNTATRILYRDIPKMSISATLTFLISLCFYERNAPYVWSLVIPFDVVPIVDPIPKREIYGYFKKYRNPIKFIRFIKVLKSEMTLLATALKMLANLQSLELHLHSLDGSDTKVLQSLLGQTTFQLRRFKTTVAFTSALSQFLQAQKELRQLHCPNSLTSRILDRNLLPPGSLPKLSTFSWTDSLPINVVRYIVKGRSIEKIGVRVKASVYSFKTVLDIGSASQSVKSLSLDASLTTLTVDQLIEIATHFPAIWEIVLRVKELNDDFMARTTASIHNFKMLDRLILASPSVKYESEEYWHGLINQHLETLFERCKTLTYVVFSGWDSNGVIIHNIFGRRRQPSDGESSIVLVRVSDKGD